jgi:hypothetical protein
VDNAAFDPRREMYGVTVFKAIASSKIQRILRIEVFHSSGFEKLSIEM